VTDDHEMHSTYEMVKGLHGRFTNFEQQFDARVSAVEVRMNQVEKEMALDKAALKSHIAESDIHRENVLHELKENNAWHEKHDAQLREHIKQDEEDRKRITLALQQENREIKRNSAKDLMYVAGQAVAIGLTLFGMLWATGVTGA